MNARIPPHDLDAEKAVLGAMMQDTEAVAKACAILDEQDFYDCRNSAIFQGIKDLYREFRVTPDPVTVHSKLHHELITLDYVMECFSACFTSQNVRHYAGIVAGKAIRRRYITAAHKVVEMAYEGEFDTIAELRAGVSSAMAVKNRESSETPSLVGELAQENLIEFERRYNEPQQAKLRYGLKNLDRVTEGAHKGEITILAARPSVGKTAFALNIAQNIAEAGKRVAFFCLEMNAFQLTERIQSNVSGVHASALRNGAISDDGWQKLSKSFAFFQFAKMRIFGPEYKTLEEIREKCRELNDTEGLDFVAIDYLQLMGSRKKTKDRREEIEYITRQMKLLALEMKIPFWVLSQLNRESEGTGGAKKRAPKLTDLRESGAIEQDADNVFLMYDPSYGTYSQDGRTQERLKMPVQIIIGKQRNGERDIIVDLDFYKATQKFMDSSGYRPPPQAKRTDLSSEEQTQTF